MLLVLASKRQVKSERLVPFLDLLSAGIPTRMPWLKPARLPAMIEDWLRSLWLRFDRRSGGIDRSSTADTVPARQSVERRQTEHR